MHVVDLDWAGHRHVVITRKAEHGQVRLRASFPLVLSVRKELNKPRYISFTGIISADSKEIKVLSNKDLKIDQKLIGLEGSPTKMAGLEMRRFDRAKEKLEGSTEEIVQKIIDKIHSYGII
jgi:electron transfer flavoprotein beta subunit